MSEDGSFSGGESEVEEVTMYSCRMCPGQEFTAAERDLHRQNHKQEKKKSGRENSPDNAPTLFEPIPQGEISSDSASTLIRPKGGAGGGGKGELGGGRKKTKPGPLSSKNGRPEKIRKIRSNKKFDRHVEQPKSDGG